MASARVESVEQGVIDTLLGNRRLQFAANVSRYIAGASAIVMVFMAIVWLLFQQYTQVLAIAVVILLITVGAGLYPFFRRRGQAKRGLYLHLGSLLFVVSIVSLLIPAVLPGAAVGYVTVIILAYLFLGDRASRGLTALAVIAFAADFVLIHVWDPGWFPPLQERTAWIIGALASIAVLLADVLVVRQIMVEQEGSFCQAEQGKMEIERFAEAERERREQLQGTVERYVDFMAKIALGNLAARLSVDELEAEENASLVVLGHNLNDTVASLQRMILQIRDVSDNLAAAASEILAATQQQTTSADERAVAVSQASTTIEEICAIAEQTAQRAQGVTDLAQRTMEVSRTGEQAVDRTVEGVLRIKGKVESIAGGVLDLSEQAQTIGQIIATVNEIAARSNMLALNAAVEAARAGEAGKGFGVVAGEVRSLAEQSREATAQVKEILSEIERGVNAAVMATEEGMKGADAGVQLTREAGAVIQELCQSVDQSTQAAAQITAAAGQQLVGMEQISQAMGSIDQATAQDLSAARQAEQAAGDLNLLAGQLRELVDRYQL